jgi:hypothetical protein
MGLSNDMRELGDLYCENLGLGPQANSNLTPSPSIPTAVTQDPEKILGECIAFLNTLQGSHRKAAVLKILETML